MPSVKLIWKFSIKAQITLQTLEILTCYNLITGKVKIKCFFDKYYKLEACKYKEYHRQDKRNWQHSTNN